ncbi:MAG: pseudouridine synthase [Planctomycetota bacterium]
MSDAAAERLQKILARCGLGSRRRCESLIVEGHVTVDGKLVTRVGTKVRPATQTIIVDGEELRFAPPAYYALYKPAGYVCSNRAQDERPLAVSIVRSRDDERLFCIGRLDDQSEGLILVTNDGEFCNLVNHPRYQVPKTYRVTLRGMPGADALEKVQRGVWLAEGKTSPAKVKIVRKSRAASILLVTLVEGKNRHLRRMFARVGLPVTGILRVRIGGINLGALKRGQYRRLSNDEVLGLRQRSWLKPGRRAAAEAAKNAQ